MKTKLKRSLPFLLILTSCISLPLFAGPEKKGPGPGAGHGKAGHGRMSDDFRGVIHALFENHEEVERAVEVTEKGYRATTTSKKPEVAAMIQKHVGQMKSRLEGGAGVRHWDPAFAEFRDFYDEMVIEVKEVEGGVSVAVTGKTPEAIQVARNHAKIVTGFVEKGPEQMHATHPPALDAKADTTASAAAKSPASAKTRCEACGKEACVAGGKGCEKGCEKAEKPCCSEKEAKKTSTES